jgi:hypothetical protein
MSTRQGQIKIKYRNSPVVIWIYPIEALCVNL